jgi:Fe-S-cluster containining protein
MIAATKTKKNAGKFSVWLRGFRRAMAHDSSSKVPCGDCTACCTSHQFIHIRPRETECLARIPKKLLAPALGLPKGSMLLGYFKNGHCPMLVDSKCALYAHRPLTCRMYDCRLFAACGIKAGAKDKTRINQAIQRWQFEYPSKQDHAAQAAVIKAVKTLQSQANDDPAMTIPAALALCAVKTYRNFLSK